MKHVLLQTTIPYAKDDWSIERFSLLAAWLGAERAADGTPLYEVVCRDRENLSSGDDRLLSTIDESRFEQLWLFGVDVGGGISPADCAAIGRFRARGGGLLTSRDHQDLGISFCALGGVGLAHHFHSRNPEPDESRRAVDDRETTTISWPNYRSGRNGDAQRVEATEPLHPVMRNGGRRIEWLPAHPHEGAVSAPAGARVIARGTSVATGRRFDLAVAFDRVEDHGRGIADSSFHHFADYNFDPRKGCPSFVTEPSGTGMLENPRAQSDARAYIANLAAWLS